MNNTTNDVTGTQIAIFVATVITIFGMIMVFVINTGIISL